MLSFNYQLSEVDEVAKIIVNQHLTQHRIILLKGELGAGKTTLIKSIAKLLGIKDEITSPTFNLLNEYAIPRVQKKLFHFDCYRIELDEEIIDLGWYEYIEDSSAWCFIEWPENIKRLLADENYLSIEIKHLNGARNITII